MVFNTIKRFQFYLVVGGLWLLLWIFSAFISNEETFVAQSVNEIWRAFYIVVVHLLFYEYSLPFILKKWSALIFNFLIGIVLIVMHLILLSFGLYGWKQLGIQLDIFTSFRHVTLIPNTAYNRIMEEVNYQAKGGITSIIFFGIAKLIHNHLKLKESTVKLRLEKQDAELNYLKSQTNPHFLFNTLNNIYSLAKDKSDLAPESILRLSKILRFMLYETGGQFISMAQEIEIIRDYIALEKLRYDESLRINFKLDVEDLGQSLPPLLLIPLVENAFKHGVSETINHPFVDIHLSTDQQQLLFVVKNSSEIVHKEESIKENIGLSNLRRQLELLYSEYNLSVQKIDTVFIATLKINLSSYV